jgi:hypothetical protein
VASMPGGRGRDIWCFAGPQELMPYLGLVPSESSTGDWVRRGGITKAGNGRVRRVLIKAAWAYRFPARAGVVLQGRQEGVPDEVRPIAWKAQVRLCSRYRKLAARGKRHAIVATAIAREIAAFVWAIRRKMAPLRLLDAVITAERNTTEGETLKPDIPVAYGWGGAQLGNPRKSTVADLVDARYQHEAIPDEHGNAVFNLRIRACKPSSRWLCPCRAQQPYAGTTPR